MSAADTEIANYCGRGFIDLNVYGSETVTVSRNCTEN